MTETDKKITGKSGKASPDKSRGRSKTSVAGWVSVLTFISVWMFVLGVLVGRGTVSIDSFGFDETHTIAKEIKRGASSGKIGRRSEHELPEKPALDFYQQLKSSAEPLYEKRKSVKKRDRKIVMPAEIPVPSVAETLSPRKKEPEKSAVKPLPKKSLVAAVFVEPPRKTGKKGGGKYSIQVAALKEHGAAREAVAKLTKKGYDAYFVKGLSKDGVMWFRIRIGSYMDRRAASGTILRLKSDKIDSFLVNK